MPKPPKLPLFWLSGSASRFLGVEIYGDASTKAWHRFLIRPGFHAYEWTITRYYQLRSRYHPRYRRHVIDTGLKPGPNLNSRLILHGMFAVLVRFVEEERGGYDALLKFTQDLDSNRSSNNPPEWIDAQVADQREMLALYKWWTLDFPALKAKRRARSEEIYGDEPLFIDVPATEEEPRHLLLRSIPKSSRKELKALDRLIATQEDEMLQRLVLLRTALD